MSKEEKELKKDLMQKDKETLVELYLQKNFDANILIQQLKTEFEKRNKKIIKDNQILGNEIKRKEVLITDLKIENEKLKNGIILHDKNEQKNIDVFVKTNTHQVCEKIREYVRNKEQYMYRNMNVVRRQSLFKFLDQLENNKEGEK